MDIFDFWLPWIRLSARMTAAWYATTPQQFQQEWQKAFIAQYWRLPRQPRRSQAGWQSAFLPQALQ